MTRREKTAVLLLWGLLLAGLMLRIWGAWIYRYDVSPERDGTALLALHMAEGHHVSAFGYGTPELGSMAPGISALLVRCFGSTGFVINMGTVLCGFLLLPLIYLWTRSAGGRMAALTALACSVIGTPALFMAGIIPSGGYALAYTLSIGVLWLAGCICQTELSNNHAPVWIYWLTGLLAGMGMWTHMLVLPALAVSAVWIILSVRLNLLNRRIIGITAAFFIGSAPWWIRRFLFNGPALPSNSTHENTRLLNGLQLLIQEGLPNLFHLPENLHLLQPALLLLSIGILTAGSLLFLRAAKQRKHASGWIHQGLALSYILCAILSLGTSGTTPADARHIAIALNPPMLLLLGSITAAMYRRMLRYRWLAFAIPALLITLEGMSLLHMQPNRPSHQRWMEADSIAAFCHEQGIQAVFVDRQEHWMNVASAESVPFCDVQDEPYVPYENSGNSATAIAMLNDQRAFSTYLFNTRVNWDEKQFGPYLLMYDFSNIPHPAQPLTTNQCSKMESSTGAVLTDALLDQDADTYWSHTISSNGPPAVLTCMLNDTIPLCGIRLWCLDNKYPLRCAVEGHDPRTDQWIPLIPSTETTPFYWSGPRWYVQGLFYRLMYRFEPNTPPLDALRLQFDPDPSRNYSIKLAELNPLGMESAYPVAEWPQRVDALLELLNKRRVLRCFADRWLAARIHTETDGRIEPVQPFKPFSAFQSRPGYTADAAVDIERLSPNDAFAVPVAEAPQLDQILRQHQITMRQTLVDPWVLFDFAPGQYARNTSAFPGLTWVGFGCLDIGNATRKLKGHFYYRKALEMDIGEGKRTYLNEAIDLYPRHKAALSELARVSTQTGDKPMLALSSRALHAMTPPIPALVHFENGVTLLGIDPLHLTARPGEALEMDYYWECPETVNPDELTVFVHFSRQGIRFQDDYNLLEHLSRADLSPQPTPETFIQHRSFTIPPGTPPGTYRWQIGLYNRPAKARIAPETDLSHYRKAVRMPVEVTVLP